MSPQAHEDGAHIRLFRSGAEALQDFLSATHSVGHRGRDDRGRGSGGPRGDTADDSARSGLDEAVRSVFSPLLPVR